MGVRSRRISMFCSFCALCLFASSAVSALERSFARDILAEPLRYQSSVAKVVGDVVKVEPDPITPGAGVYTILDSSDCPLRVRTKAQLPKIGDRVYVVGLVYQDDPQSKPFLDELRRGHAGPPLRLLVGAAGLLALTAFILVYLLIWHHPTALKTEKRTDSSRRKPVVTQVFEDDPVAVLSAVSGPHKGKTFNIYRGVTTIGREENQTIQLPEDQTISRQQARVLSENGTISLVNESRTNPTTVDGSAVEKRDLSDGDVIQMGATRLKLTLLDQ